MKPLKIKANLQKLSIPLWESKQFWKLFNIFLGNWYYFKFIKSLWIALLNWSSLLLFEILPMSFHDLITNPIDDCWSKVIVNLQSMESFSFWNIRLENFVKLLLGDWKMSTDPGASITKKVHSTLTAPKISAIKYEFFRINICQRCHKLVKHYKIGDISKPTLPVDAAAAAAVAAAHKESQDFLQLTVLCFGV